MGVGSGKQGTVTPWIFIHTVVLIKTEGAIFAIFWSCFSYYPHTWKIFCRHPWQYVLEFQINHAQRHRKWGKWGHVPRGAGLGGVSTHFIQTFKKRVFTLYSDI